MEKTYISIQKVNNNHYVLDPIDSMLVCDGFEELIDALRRQFGVVDDKAAHVDQKNSH